MNAITANFPLREALIMHHPYIRIRVEQEYVYLIVYCWLSGRGSSPDVLNKGQGFDRWNFFGSRVENMREWYALNSLYPF